MFEKLGSGEIKLTVTVTGVAPASAQHGIHIHANASCADASDGDGGTTIGGGAGGHWNPESHMHGTSPATNHLGDIGNIMVDANGAGTLTFMTSAWTIDTGAANDIVNHALILHASTDDGTTQPTGNAGGRMAASSFSKVGALSVSWPAPKRRRDGTSCYCTESTRTTSISSHCPADPAGRASSAATGRLTFPSFRRRPFGQESSSNSVRIVDANTFESLTGFRKRTRGQLWLKVAKNATAIAPAGPSGLITACRVTRRSGPSHPRSQDG